MTAINAKTAARSLLLLLPMLCSTGHAAPTLCRAEETTYFSCSMKKTGKVASLCGGISVERNFLHFMQYRVGRLNGPLEFVFPDSIAAPEMSHLFFYDPPSITRDHTLAELGIWFRAFGAWYELSTLQEDPFGRAEVDTRSTIRIWKTESPRNAPQEYNCESVSPSTGLKEGATLIESMAPVSRTWMISPYDWERVKNRDAVHESQSSRGALP
jgi:hypothetical protein